MIKIKTTALVILLSVFGIRTVSAQKGSNIVLEGSQVFSTFRFVNADGKTENNFSSRISGAFNVGYQYAFEKGIILGGAVGLYNGGATRVYNDENYEWNLQYERIKLDLGYIYTKWWIKPYVLASPYYGYMLKGSQSTGNVNYDLKKNNDLQTSDVGVIGAAGVRVKIANAFSAFAAYNYNMGLLNIEKTAGQKLYNRGSYISVGLLIQMPCTGKE